MRITKLSIFSPSAVADIPLDNYPLNLPINTSEIVAFVEISWEIWSNQRKWPELQGEVRDSQRLNRAIIQR